MAFAFTLESDTALKGTAKAGLFPPAKCKGERL
jgi:hypothetical protein